MDPSRAAHPKAMGRKEQMIERCKDPKAQGKGIVSNMPTTQGVGGRRIEFKIYIIEYSNIGMKIVAVLCAPDASGTRLEHVKEMLSIRQQSIANMFRGDRLSSK